MSTDQFDPDQIVRIRMTVEPGVASDHPEAKTVILWSTRMPRKIAEVDLAGGPYHLAIEHGDGRRVLSAAIVSWKGN